MQQICESVEALPAAGSPPDVLAALDWAMGQPQHKAHPRQLFLLTAASPMATVTHQTLDLMRWHRGAARYGTSRASCLRWTHTPYSTEALEGHSFFPSLTRCFSFGLGPACPQLLQGLSALSRGQAYFLRPGERLQPMVSLSLALFPTPATPCSFSQVTLSLKQNRVRSWEHPDQDFSPTLITPLPRCQSGEKLLWVM